MGSLPQGVWDLTGEGVLPDGSNILGTNGNHWITCSVHFNPVFRLFWGEAAHDASRGRSGPRLSMFGRTLSGSGPAMRLGPSRWADNVSVSSDDPSQHGTSTAERARLGGHTGGSSGFMSAASHGEN